MDVVVGCISTPLGSVARPPYRIVRHLVIVGVALAECRLHVDGQRDQEPAKVLVLVVPIVTDVLAYQHVPFLLMGVAQVR